MSESDKGLSADSGMHSSPNNYGQNGGLISGGDANQQPKEEKSDKLIKTRSV